MESHSNKPIGMTKREAYNTATILNKNGDGIYVALTVGQWRGITKETPQIWDGISEKWIVVCFRDILWQPITEA
jgi:hypothetical protein